MAHDENGEEIGEQEVVVTTRWYMRMFVFLCAVATEVCTWSGILFAGKSLLQVQISGLMVP